jgi:nicotinamidase-related amidase
MTLTLTPSTTAVILMDFQVGIVARLPEPAEALVKRVRAVLDAARTARALVAYVQVAFRPGFPEISDRNVSFATVKAGSRMRLGNPETAIIRDVAPLETEPVVTKHRVGAFGGTDLETILRAQKIDTLVLLGVATSGCVLSTLRAAADLDYRLVVASDGCADMDAEVHRVLMEKVFPRQASVTTTEAVIQALKGSAH